VLSGARYGTLRRLVGSNGGFAQATPESRLRGEVALFCHPSARNTEKRWSTDPFRKAWVQACEDAGVPFVSFQQASRHTTLSQLAKVLPERMLQAHSRHRDKRSLDPYVLSSPQPEAIVQAMRPHGSAPNQPPGDQSEESSR
jgi:integrase